jgi:ribosomal protein S18 acetylase RimI-like enzyme
MKHLPSIIGLLNEEYETLYEFVPFSEERVLSHIKRWNLTVRVAEEDGKVVGLIGTHPEEKSEESIHWLAALPGPDQRAIEDALVNETEKNSKGGVVSTMIDEGSPKISVWLNRGYVLQPGFMRMSARLDGVKPVPKVAEGIELRSLKPGEEEKLIEVINAGFGWQRLEPGVLERWKSEEPLFSEEWVQVAENSKRLVSAVVAKPDTDYVKHFHVNRGYLGPAATLPEFRNKHLASALTVRAMNFLFEKGMDSVRLGTSEQNVSSVTLLRSLGFQVEHVRKILRKKLKNT